MIFADPPPTQADLHFRVFGVPVRVHPFFWLIGLLLGLSAGQREPTAALLMIAVFFVSILVHELGHAALQRKFGGRPRIVLHGFGGLAICDDCDRSPRNQILISLAGPGAGFLLAAAALLVTWIIAGSITFVPAWAWDSWLASMDQEQLERLSRANLIVGDVIYPRFDSPSANMLLKLILWVNIFWGLVNLLPIYPLDGGQVARELFTLGPYPREGIVRSLQLSVGFGVGTAVFALLVLKSPFMAILFGYLAYTNYRTWQAYTGRGPGMGWQ